MTNTSAAASLANSAQARATRQSALTTLMGAGSARPQPTGQDSEFADTLNAASENTKNPLSFFSDAPVAVPDQRPSIERRTKSPANREQPPEQNAPSEATDAAVAPAEVSVDTTSTAGSFKPNSGETEYGTSPCLPGSPVAATPNAALPTPTNQPAGTGEVAQTTNANGPAASEEDSPVNGKTKVSGPTDPLRLIQPQAAPNAGTPGSDAADSSAAAASNSNSPVMNGSPGPGNNGQTNGNPNNQGAQHTPVQSTMTVAATSGMYSAPIAQGQTAQGADAPNSALNGNISATGNAGPTGTANPTSGPFRVSNGRPETPISIKLRATPQGPNSESLTQPEADSIAKILSRNLNTALNQKTPLITLWMAPDILGKVKISLTFDQGTVSARFEATSEATKNLLEQNSGALRQALESRGLRADKIEVVAVPDGNQQTPVNGGNTAPSQGSGQTSNSGPQSGNGQPGNGQSGNGQPGNGQPGNGQPGNGNQGGQNGNPNSGQTAHSDGWTNGNSGSGTQHLGAGSSGGISRIDSQIDTRLITLNARLELDAVA